jgi:uncharacterized protein
MFFLLPIAGVSVHLPLLIGVGVLVGFLSGLLGVGGGFLLTPILMMIGIPPTVAAASDSCQILAASSSGVGAHFRQGNVDIKLGSILILGGMLGGAIGVRIIHVLRALGSADFVITVAYIVVLGGTGGYMFFESLGALRRGVLVPKIGHAPGGMEAFVSKLPWRMSFPCSRVEHSVLVPIVLAMLVGVLSAIMGVGGGFIIVPIMVYLLGIPMHVTVGTSLFQVLFTCAGVTFMQATQNHTVDLTLALLLAAGSTIGAQIGARLARVLRGDQLKIVLASIILVVTSEMAVGIILMPSTLVTYAKGH